MGSALKKKVQFKNIHNVAVRSELGNLSDWREHCGPKQEL